MLQPKLSSRTLILLLLAAFAIGCAHRAPAAPRSADQLQIVVDAKYSLDSGYGTLWRATITAATSPA